MIEVCEGRRPHIMVAWIGQNSHDRGTKGAAHGNFLRRSRLRWADIGALFQTLAEVASEIVENDAHLIGRSMNPSRPPKLLDQMREALRSRHYSRRTEQTYCQWVKRYIFFHKVRHPAEMAEPEINAFLTHLAVKEKVSASTQNQALSALTLVPKLQLGNAIPEAPASH